MLRAIDPSAFTMSVHTLERTKIRRLRRCPLSVPGSSQKMLARAAALDCDAVILDLEDSVAPNAKAEARRQVIAAITELDWSPATISLRINAVDTPWCHDDVIDVVSAAGSLLHTIVLAKVRTTHDVMFVHLLLDQLECKLGLTRRIGIECLIEDVEGMMNVEQIAGCSDRLESMIFGMGDYAASQGMNVQRIGEGSDLYPGDLWHYPRYKMIIACRVHGLEPIDGPYADFRDIQAFRIECQQADLLGMAGKWAIHPDQIAVGNEAFSPPAEVVASARKQKAAYVQALAAGEGSINVDGVMVDAASIRLQQNILDRADLIGMP
ncbi:MAG: citrate lyase subunit beta/citryl-CoA lyase [Cyclobacteriaceae bacterium]|jgi:citrate lyase subunit beta/citryl-CoA lyase